MLAGHFGVAAGARSTASSVPLWALLLGSQLLDVVFVPLVLAGVEGLRPVPGVPAYGGAVIDAPYSHALLTALVLAAAAGTAGALRWGRRAGAVLGATVLSHWPLDLVVHRPDLPILPGNAGGLPLLGLGLWRAPVASAAVEAALVLAGALLYARSVRRREAAAVGRTTARSTVAAGTVGVLLAACLATDVSGL